MSDQTNRPENAGIGVSSALQERDKSDATEEDSLPIGAGAEKTQGRENAQGCSDRNGNSKQLPLQCGTRLPATGPEISDPGGRVLPSGAWRRSSAKQNCLENSVLDTETTRTADVERAYQFILDDPKLSACREPETPLTIEAKRLMVRMYELLTGRMLLN